MEFTRKLIYTEITLSKNTYSAIIIQIKQKHQCCINSFWLFLGKTGSIIKQYPSCFAVDPAATILSGPQAQMISSIAQTGYYYLQLCTFITEELTEISFADAKKNPSLYRKAIAQGLKICLKQYESLILEMEASFLNNRHFTFSTIKSQLSNYAMIMEQIHTIIIKIVNEKYRGAVIIDIFWENYQKGPLWLREWTEAILRECEKVFVNQVIAWIAHGQLIDVQGEFFIHKVMHQPEEKIQFTSLNHKSIEMTGWGIYTLDLQLVPTSIVSAETAAKILFIGKSVKILLRSGKISSIPSKKVLNDLRTIIDSPYNQIIFESTIETIRKSIAEEMIKLIIGEENLIKELEKINEYYLMKKGDFYHHFLEEAKCIEVISSREKVQKKINEVCLPNTFIRLGQPEETKRVNFQLKALGFSYIGFKNFVNICPVGNIDLVEGKYIRFSSSGGGVWHRTKQVVENNFNILFTLSFKRSKNMFRIRRDDLKYPSNFVSLVIQNNKDISPSAYENPSALAHIKEYLSINIGYRYSQAEKNYESFITVSYKNMKKFNQKDTEVGRCCPKKINFLDQNTYFVKISYSQDAFKIGLTPVNAPSNQFEEELTIDRIRLSSYLNLEMNRANIGLLSSIQDFSCQAEIEQWEMISKPSNHHGDHWSDISIKMNIPWPLNLILTQDLMEIFSRIHKFLFPVRQTQIQLESIWVKIPRRIRQVRHANLSKNEQRQLNIFERKLSASRARMNMVVNNLWAYLETDVIDTAWSKLKQTLANSDDFQDVIRMLTKYVNTIQAMFYFNALKIQRHIHEIIRQCRNFLTFFQKLDSENVIDSKTIAQYEHLDDLFRKNVSDFNKLLKQLSKSSNSTHLFHLTQRIEGCVENSFKYLYD